MMKNGAHRKAIAIGAVAAAGLLSTVAVSPAASADTTRTLNLSFSCATGEAYGLLVDTGSGFYAPDGSSTVAGSLKTFTVFIPAAATSLRYMPLSCANEPQGGNGPAADWSVIGLTPGTSTINAYGSCQDYVYNAYGVKELIMDCSVSSLAYS